MKNLTTVFVIIFGMIACKSQTNQPIKKDMVEKKAPIESFWNWFQANEKDLRNVQSNPDNILSLVLDSARKIQAGLAIEFEPQKNGIINVTVSADGDKNLFPTVEKIVAMAPKIKGWNFIAFRQRAPKEVIKGMVLKTEGHELNPDKMKFFPVQSDDSLDIIIYADGITENNFNEVAYGGLLLVDNILGEYDCVTKVRSYDFQNMPTDTNELKDLKPLLDLANYVDNFHLLKNK